VAADRVNESEWRRWNDDRWTAAWPERERLTNTVTPHLLRAMALQPGERVLDIGCGGGGLTIAAAEAVGLNGAVVGADLSSSLLDLATQRAAAAGASNASFVVVDAQTDQIPGAPFDVAVSQFGVMFFDEPVTAFANIRGHLRPAARLVFVCWQPVDRNPWHSSSALRPFLPPTPPPAAGKSVVGPFAFGDIVQTSAILDDAGFTEIRSEAQETTVDAPMGAVFDDWQLDFLGVPAAQQAEARTAVEDHVARLRIGPDLYRYPLAYLVFEASNPE
jgi:SAM-dependent methyltransferase